MEQLVVQFLDTCVTTEVSSHTVRNTKRPEQFLEYLAPAQKKVNENYPTSRN